MKCREPSSRCQDSCVLGGRKQDLNSNCQQLEVTGVWAAFPLRRKHWIGHLSGNKGAHLSAGAGERILSRENIWCKGLERKCWRIWVLNRKYPMKGREAIILNSPKLFLPGPPVASRKILLSVIYMWFHLFNWLITPYKRYIYANVWL